jgi:FSR family fosmidomycin resistance protein-like MFS transporter
MALSRKPLFWVVSFAHFTIDIFNASVPVLVTFLAAHFIPMTNTQIGIAVSGYQLTSALSQPLAGWLADRSGGRWLGAGGVAWTISLISIALLIAAGTHSYTLTIIPLIAAALGSGAFHPVGTMHAADCEATPATSRLSIFFFAGQTGGGIGPAITGLLLDGALTRNAVFGQAFPSLTGLFADRGAVTPMLALALIAIPSVILMGIIVPSAQRFAAAHGERKVSRRAEHHRIGAAAVITLIALIAMRGFVNPGSASFLPRLFQMRGWSAAEYGLITSAFWLSGGITGIVFGFLADRFGSRLMIAASMFLTVPAVFGLVAFDGAGAFLMALAMGALSGGSHSLLVAMAHRIMPAGKGLASGAVLGLIFGMGAVGVLIIGRLSDSIGLPNTFHWIGAATLIAGLLALLLPKDRPLRQPKSAEAVRAAAPASGD